MIILTIWQHIQEYLLYIIGGSLLGIGGIIVDKVSKNTSLTKATLEQTKPNHGSSMRDALDKMLAESREIRKDMEILVTNQNAQKQQIQTLNDMIVLFQRDTEQYRSILEGRITNIESSYRK